MVDNRPLIVSIHCLTYNHEPYIRECLDGFVMQKTNFRFEAIVHDDVSTDGTAGIIREYAEKYPEIIKPIYESENQYTKHDGSLDRIMNDACKGKYIAYCEGDDYWIDPLKLQKQVELMESDEAIGLVYSKARIRKGTEIYGDISAKEHSFKDLLINNNIPTATTLFRRSCLENYRKEVSPDNKGWLMTDYPHVLYVSLRNKIGFIDEFLSVRRIVDGSACNNPNLDYMIRFRDSVTNIQFYFLDNIYSGIDKSEIKNRLFKEGEIYKLSLMLKLGRNLTEAKHMYKQLKNCLSWKSQLYYYLLFLLSTLNNKLRKI